MGARSLCRTSAQFSGAYPGLLFGQPNNDLRLMQGLSVKSLKHHVALQPLFIIMTAGIIFVGAYCGRLAFNGHDVNFSKKKDPVEPMSTLENKQFKMFNVSGFDYSDASAQHIEAHKYRD